MKKRYLSPYIRIIDLVEEGMIASSLDKLSERAGDDFLELSNKRNQEKDIWDDEGSIWK